MTEKNILELLGDSQILDWIEKIRADIYYDEGSPCSIEYVTNEIKRINESSLRDCVIKAMEEEE